MDPTFHLQVKRAEQGGGGGQRKEEEVEEGGKRGQGENTQ
jgi:hypothetical protein